MSKNKQTFTDPLDMALPTPAAEAPPPEVRKRKQPATIVVIPPPEILERIRNAVFWNPGMTMREFGETAVKMYLEQMEKKHGKTYPQRTGKLRTGVQS